MARRRFKIKELIVDVRRNKTAVIPVSIQRGNVGIVEDYKYLWLHINNKRDCSKNKDYLYRNSSRRLYFLRRLRSFNICQAMLMIFYESVEDSTILFAVACWGSRLRVMDAYRLNKLICKASGGSGVGCFDGSAQRRMRYAILDNVAHPFHDTQTDWSNTRAHLVVDWFHQNMYHIPSESPSKLRQLDSITPPVWHLLCWICVIFYKLNYLCIIDIFTVTWNFSFY